MFPDISQLLIMAPAFIFALTFHEFAHAWSANKLNDPTAKNEGRLTLNPLVHLDPVGTIMLFVVGFGWARPVPVNPRNLQNPRQDMMWIALAGPCSNVLLAFALGWLYYNTAPTSEMMSIFRAMLQFGVYINLVLCFFNLLPIPPLDGSRIITGLLPQEQAYQFSKLEQFGPGLLIGLIVLDRFMNLGLLSSLILSP
ncbi:MAG: site-2 protease family protein, partial [Gemmatimonadota bacterium]|nr:site-2 protease family protein [Gemmatimonadota bacterium]